VIRSYLGFYAIAAHRVAHELLGHGARMLARMIAAHAHRKTGIDEGTIVFIACDRGDRYLSGDLFG
jgi:cysteine synthase